MARMERSRQLDKWYAHESLDRMYIVMESFNLFINEHPFVAQTPELKLLADDISDRLYQMYNAISIESDKYENND